MKRTGLYLIFVLLVTANLYASEIEMSHAALININTYLSVEKNTPDTWFFIKPEGKDSPSELEITGKSQISVQNLGAFNGISDKEKSINFNLGKGVIINKSAVFGTSKIKTPRTALAINSALHFVNGATYQFRQHIGSGEQSWARLNGNNLSGTVAVDAGADRHINGYISYDGPGLFVFPVGDGINQYYPLSVSGNAGQTITAAWLPNDPDKSNDPTDKLTSHSRAAFTGDIKHVYSSGQWDWHIRNTSASLTNDTAPENVMPSGPVTISVTIPEDINVLTQGETDHLRLVGWNGSAWEALDNSTIDSETITASVNKAFSAITFGAIENNSIDLTTFSAHKEEKNSVLNWETALETDSKYFEVEHSIDGNNWVTLNNVAINTNDNKALTFTYVDKNPVGGENFYRLKIAGADKTVAYSQIQRLQFEENGKVTLFPNPVSETLMIDTHDNWKDVANVSLFNNAGRLVHSSEGAAKTIDVKALISGKYIVVITKTDGRRDSYHIVVNR